MLILGVRNFDIAERDTSAQVRANYTPDSGNTATSATIGAYRGYLGGMALRPLAGNLNAPYTAFGPNDGTNLSLDGRGVTAGVNLGPTGFAGDPGSSSTGVDSNGFPALPAPIQGTLGAFQALTGTATIYDAPCIGIAKNDAEFDILGSPQSGSPQNSQSIVTASKTPYEAGASEHQLGASILRNGLQYYPWLYAGATPIANIAVGMLGAIELYSGKWIFAYLDGSGGDPGIANATFAGGAGSGGFAAAGTKKYLLVTTLDTSRTLIGIAFKSI